MLKIGVDAMGGDYAPEAAVKGAVMALDAPMQFMVIIPQTARKSQPFLGFYNFLLFLTLFPIRLFLFIIS